MQTIKTSETHGLIVTLNVLFIELYYINVLRSMSDAEQ